MAALCGEGLAACALGRNTARRSLVYIATSYSVCEAWPAPSAAGHKLSCGGGTLRQASVCGGGGRRGEASLVACSYQASASAASTHRPQAFPCWFGALHVGEPATSYTAVCGKPPSELELAGGHPRTGAMGAMWGGGCSERCRVATNLQNQGLISVDRNNKATLLLTIPRSLFKSSAKDLSPPTFEIAIRVTLI